MLTDAYFAPASRRSVRLRVDGDNIYCEAFHIPDRKTLVIAGDRQDGRAGRCIVHSTELHERTKGQTSHMEVANGFRLRSMLRHIGRGGLDEDRRLRLRIDELKMSYDYFLHAGPIKEGEHMEITGILRDIERDLGEPKRNPDKLAAARNVGVGLRYRSPRAGNPVGPVIAMATKGAIARLEVRLAQILGVRRFVSLRYHLVDAHLKEAEKLFKSLKEEKSMQSESFAGLIGKLDFMRMQPFEAPSRRIEKLYDSYRYGDGVESEVFADIRRELHAVLLVCVIERQIIERLSRMAHERLSKDEMVAYRLAAIHALEKIGKRVDECSSFSKSVRHLAAVKLGHARNILAQEDMFETPRKRLKSADRILKELTAVLPV